MTSTAIATRPSETAANIKWVTVPPAALEILGKDPSLPVHVPFESPPVPTQQQARQAVGTGVAVVALRSASAPASLFGAHWLGTIAMERGAPLVAQFATLDWSNLATLKAAAIAGGAAALGAVGLFGGIKALLDFPKMGQPLWDPLGVNTTEAVAQKAKDLGVKAKVYATQAAATVAAAGAAAYWFLEAPASLVALGVGAAAAVGSFFFGRAATRAGAELTGPVMEKVEQLAALAAVDRYIEEQDPKLLAPPTQPN